MKSRSRSATAALTAGVTALMLSSCAGGASDSGKVTLEFQTAQAADSPLLAVLTEITEQFESENPGVDIDLKTGGNDYESQIKVRLAARNPPDIWATHGWSLLRYGQFLAPLQDEPWAEHFNPALAPVMKNDDGEFFALPVDTAVSGLIVNETVLERAGLSADDITDWDSFLAAAEAVAATGAVPLTLAGSKDGSAGNVVDWLAPGAFDEDQLASFEKGEFDADGYEKILAVLETFRSKGWINPDYSSATGDDMARSLAQDRAAFALSSNVLVTQALSYAPGARLAFVPVPAMNGTESYLIGGENTAFGAARDGDHLDEAKEYLAYLAQPENDAALAQATGSIPGLTNVEADLGVLQPSYEKWVEPGTVPLRPFFDRAYLPNGMWNTVVTTADSVIAGQSSPADSTKKVADDFATLYKEAE
ncbi:raffinose/stachyose/melibiose transport system substrate-binding protein [Diaminobutyricimonas aerilata]|uniref:Raffinose/stachyose/melibiose transport system substrate-binding protein n=1 Tax=Diaminobutyricimonas aerilata TaxID=1162967 RepID=A0A2M9CJL1_9MICO|nr:ABC transporter substrate-binding protein [Diaminobutyricimonas aerilata]PJJ72087.1 raffinose/stachyose/melibiose transport system substrate-binding protein [Diaminobutyricimonas aerilata]